MQALNETTRRYPRTTTEAFPKSMEAGACLFVPYKKPRQTGWWVAIAVVALIIIGLFK